ncbi:MAG: hypothetical protein KDA28_10210, partial [Phycisphaerales bacterium]|nr:hypothetical protein [Phycisphaerales bacterium]
FTYVSNAVLATLLAGSRPLRGEVMNVGTGDRTSINDLASSIARACDAAHLAPVHVGTRAGDVRDSLASIDLARSLLGYEPNDDLDAGLRETVDWYREAYASSGNS